MIPLDTPIPDIRRIQPLYQKRLLKLGVQTLRHLFYHFPHRYDDFSKITAIADLKLSEVATVQGKIMEIKNIRTWKKKMMLTEAYVQDATGVIKTIWFNQPYLINTLKRDSFVSLSGKVNIDKTLYLSNPAYEKIAANDEPQITTNTLRHTGRLVPVYPETAGLSSRYLRYFIQIFSPAISQFRDWLPLEIKKSQRLIDLKDALLKIHFPDSPESITRAKRRLAFDELFLIQLYVLRQKIKWQKNNSPKISFDEQLIKDFVTRLPFKLTDAQRRATWEILLDLNKNKPMNRLLEGDVGSGKTVVATIAALQIAKRGWQVALMAPTEILAGQHYKTMQNLLKALGLKITLLTGAKKEKEAAAKIAAGEIQITVGTHALIQKTIKFKNLALAIVDEQHRFGVEQRAALQNNVAQIEDGASATIPHLLSMTATPIPRTLALTIYGDLDISLLDELPKGRRKIITRIVTPTGRQAAYEFIRWQARQNRQVFVICPRIEPTQDSAALGQAVSEDRHSALAGRQDWREWSRTNGLPKRKENAWDDVKAVKEEYEKLSKKIFPELKIAMLHGKMKSKEKEQIMVDFKKGKADILVSTSVVEVGIDVPNATVMMIEGAERFGLAQLHQFRGRVGRGKHQSYCFLFADSSAKTTNARLRALITCQNGFELAEKDLAIRGPGEFYGSRQWGLPDLSMASLADLPLIKTVRQEAAKLLSKDAELKNYPLLNEKLKDFQTTIHLE